MLSYSCHKQYGICLHLDFTRDFAGSGLIVDAAPGNRDSTVTKDSTFDL